MKRVVASVVCIACLALILGGCVCNGEIDIGNKNIHTDCEGVYLDIVAVKSTDKGDALAAVWHNESEGYITFGNAYMIEYLDGVEWKSVLARDFAITEIACMLYKGEICEKDYETQYFNLSKEGTYRLRCDFYVPEGEHTGAYETWVEFYVMSKR